MIIESYYFSLAEVDYSKIVNLTYVCITQNYVLLFTLVCMYLPGNFNGNDDYLCKWRVFLRDYNV